MTRLTRQQIASGVGQTKVLSLGWKVIGPHTTAEGYTIYYFDNELEAQVWCANNPGSNLYRKTGAYLIWERINV